jgi:hypothetical protein
MHFCLAVWAEATMIEALSGSRASDAPEFEGIKARKSTAKIGNDCLLYLMAQPLELKAPRTLVV